MIKKIFALLLIATFTSTSLADDTSCLEIVNSITAADSHKSENSHQVVILLNWSINQKENFLAGLKKAGYKKSEIEQVIRSLNITSDLDPENTLNYLSYVKTLSDKNQIRALADLPELNSEITTSESIRNFNQFESKIQKSIKKIERPEGKARFRELYYGCRAFKPNAANKRAASQFKKFSLSMNLLSLAGGYAVFHRNDEKDAAWYGNLAYDLGFTVLFSFVSSKIQTNEADMQLTKSLKKFAIGRTISLTDLSLYDYLFNHERDEATKEVNKLKKDPRYKEEVERLLKLYQERNAYRRLKDYIVKGVKSLPDGFSLGVEGNSIDENGVDWNNLTQADLDRPEVQDVLVAAAMLEIYQHKKGNIISTGDLGADKYVYNTLYFAAQIPKNIFTSLYTYNTLCMGQDNLKAAYSKAFLFNVADTFIFTLINYQLRHKIINQ